MADQEQPVYATDHSKNVVAHHGRRKVSDSAKYLLPHLRDKYGPPENANLKFLDAGCGPGSITRDFAQNYYPKSHFTGMEYTDDPIKQAKAAAQDAGITNAEFTKGDIHDIPFPDNTFDVVYCHQVLQHIADPIKALMEMRRVCKPGGIVGAKESCSSQWYPDLLGIKAKSDLHYKVSRAMGGNPFPGHYIHVWAKQAGFTRDQITCSASSWLFTTPQEREYWGGNYAGRMDPDGERPSAFVKNALEGGHATVEELRTIRDDFRRWVGEEDGWYCIGHGEIVCVKE